jgi:hypothetical protein
LNSLPTIPIGPSRDTALDGLLAISNFWGTTEQGYLEALKNTTHGSQEETELILALRVYMNAKVVGATLLTEGMVTIIQGFPSESTEERLARVEVLRGVPIWGDDIIKLVNLYDTQPETATLITYLTRVLASIPTLKLRLDVLKAGIGGVLDTLPSLTSQQRDPIILGILGLHAWNETQIFFLNELRTQSNADAVYINALKISTGSLDTLPSDRNELIGSLLAIENFLTEEQKAILESLYNPVNDLIDIPRLNALVSKLTIMSGYTLFEQSQVIDGIISQNIWGEYYYNLNDLRQVQPGFIGEAGVVTGLDTSLNEFPPALGYLVDGVNDALTNIPATQEERTPIIDSIKLIPIWGGEGNLTTLELLKTPSVDDQTYKDELTSFINGILTAYTNTLGLLTSTQPLTEQDMDILGGYTFWGPEQIDILQKLREIVGDSSATEDYYKKLLETYVKGLDFYLKTVNDGLRATITGAPTGVTDPVDRNILVEILLGFSGIWGDDQLTLLNEFRTVDSVNHEAAVDAITGHLDSLYGTTIPGLISLLQTPGTTSADLTNTNDPDKIAAWGGYFYDRLEQLKVATITPDPDESDIITKLVTHVNITSLSDTRNDNLKFLLSQLTVKYPDTIFNKWIRAKKNVPLMYSKQKTTTLECDGVKILDETTGSNMFLSASLPNVYHKRSPNFRNINMYSFALYPNELQPSGHLNFSTIKDAYLTMDLEYDGAHGTFDFDDNFITLFDIDPIYFPKQVIIIAKSYNMMIIRNGRAQILF